MTPEQWNATYPIGTAVRVTSVRAHDGHKAVTFDTVTRSVCWALGHGTPVVLVEGKTGGYSVEPGWMAIEYVELTVGDVLLTAQIMVQATEEERLVIEKRDTAELRLLHEAEAGRGETTL